MLRAFTYMTKDNKIMQKIFTLYGLMGLCIVLLLLGVKLGILGTILAIIFILVIACVMCGYWLNCVKAVSEQKENIVLPLMNFKQNFIFGIRNYIAGALFALGMAIVLLIPFVFSSGENIISMIICFFMLLLILAITFIQPALTWIFVQTNDLFAYFRFDKAVDFVSQGKKQYTFSVLVLWLLNVLFSVLTSEKLIPVPALTMAFSIIYKFAIPYLMLVTAYLIGKAINYECNIEL